MWVRRRQSLISVTAKSSHGQAARCTITLLVLARDQIVFDPVDLLLEVGLALRCLLLQPCNRFLFRLELERKSLELVLMVTPFAFDLFGSVN